MKQRTLPVDRALPATKLCEIYQQLFHRSHPWIFSAAISVLFCAAVFLKPFPCSYFIAVIPGNISVAISVFFLQPYSWNHFPAAISSQSSLEFFLQPCLFFLQPYSWNHFPAAISSQSSLEFFLQPFPFFFCSHIPETISLQLFHRSHPWNFFCSHFRFFFAAVFLKPFPCSYFIAVIPGIFSAAISVFFLQPYSCNHLPAAISSQSSLDFFCSHVFFFCSRIPETISLQVSSQSSLEFFLQPFLFDIYPNFWAAIFQV